MKWERLFGYIPYVLLFAIILIGIGTNSDDVVTAVAGSQRGERENTVVIDAGHGGIDGGATSCSGVLESGINLQIAVKLNDLIRFLGYETVMIRTEDTSLHTGGNSIAAQKLSDLKQRVRIVEETPGAVLISVHQNTYPSSRYHGAQVFYSQNSESRPLAELVQKAFIMTINPESKRQIKKAEGVYLMKNTTCPGILVECGFLSNPQEEALLRDTAYQQKICCVISSALMAFLEA